MKKNEIKRIAKELKFEEAKIYKWFWERNKKDWIESQTYVWKKRSERG